MPSDSNTCGATLSTHERIFHEVRTIFALGVATPAEQILPEHRLEEDLGCDSLDLVEITMEVEEHFDISVPEDVADEINRVNDIVNGVVRIIDEG